MRDEQMSLIHVSSEVLPEPDPPPCVIYLVAAYNGHYWKIHRDSGHEEYTRKGDAEEAAARLSSQWTHKRILKVVL